MQKIAVIQAKNLGCPGSGTVVATINGRDHRAAGRRMGRRYAITRTRAGWRLGRRQDAEPADLLGHCAGGPSIGSRPCRRCTRRRDCRPGNLGAGVGLVSGTMAAGFTVSPGTAPGG